MNALARAGQLGPAHLGDPDTSALAERSARYGALDLCRHPVWIFDIDRRRVHWANTAALQIWRARSLQELCTRDMGADMSDTVALRLAQYQVDFIAHRASFNEQWTLYPAGVPVSLHVNFDGHVLPDGRMAMLCQAEPSDNRSPESLRSVDALMHTPVMITLYTRDGLPLYRNPAARSSVRDPAETLAGRIVDAAAATRLQAELARQQAATCTLAVHTAHGQRWHELSARHCRDPATGADAMLVSEADVSTLKRTEAKANFLALHDSLTGLPNRAHVLEHFARMLGEVLGTGTEAALIFIDLDHFKDVNDTLGHAAGDELLVQVATRLRSVTRGGDLVARLGGDEFLILLAAHDIRHEVDRVRERIAEAVSRPVLLGGNEVRVTPTMGVSLYPQDGQDIQTLMRNADLAMYSAKERGRNELAYYDAAMGVAVHKRATLEAELRRAIDRDEFELHYQPRLLVSTGLIVGAEALLRWKHPERGIVLPEDFIPACEDMGLIQQLGMQTFERAVRQQAAWARAGHVLCMSVNLSARQFKDSRLLQGLERALRGADCDPSQVELEITESMLLGTDDRPELMLRVIESLGMRIAVDDFGTGFSNLAYLQRFPIHTLKIDRTFIQSIHTEQPLAELIVAMCHLMRLTVVAEGVETQAQLDWIAGREIEQYQGHLFSPALPAAAFEVLLRERASGD